MIASCSKMNVEMKRIYLDVCCLNRPFDDQEQDRIRFESEAVRFILKHIRKGDFIWVGSSVLYYEIANTPDPDRKNNVLVFTERISEKVILQLQDEKKVIELQSLGFGVMDALHVVCAEKAEVEVLLTTDDRFLKKGIAHSDKLNVRIENPVVWLQEVIE